MRRSHRADGDQAIRRHEKSSNSRDAQSEAPARLGRALLWGQGAAHEA